MLPFKANCCYFALFEKSLAHSYRNFRKICKYEKRKICLNLSFDCEVQKINFPVE